MWPLHASACETGFFFTVIICTNQTDKTKNTTEGHDQSRHRFRQLLNNNILGHSSIHCKTRNKSTVRAPVITWTTKHCFVRDRYLRAIQYLTIRVYTKRQNVAWELKFSPVVRYCKPRSSHSLAPCRKATQLKSCSACINGGICDRNPLPKVLLLDCQTLADLDPWAWYGSGHHHIDLWHG